MLLVGESAWSPVESTYDHFLKLDLGERKEIRYIATKGRARTSEYVTEYIVQFSDDGESWRSFADANGETEVRIISKIYCYLSNKYKSYLKFVFNKFLSCGSSIVQSIFRHIVLISCPIIVKSLL